MCAEKNRSANTLAASPLGKATSYPDRYQPDLLFPLPRAPQREFLGPGGALTFDGADFWTAYEMAWLNPSGKPQTAVLTLSVPAQSARIVESKSLKLYLGSFAQEPMRSDAEVSERVASDLAVACGAAVRVGLMRAEAMATWHAEDLPGDSIDELDVTIDRYEPDSRLLRSDGPMVEESLRSALFKANCPVTGQPDYADVAVRYRGSRIDRSSLLRYIISYRKHNGFHEGCVEQMFVDIQRECRPTHLTVYARFLRRGGIDINPYRSNFEAAPLHPRRTPRQ
jgi:7-cyano-7-deazaguanine reductase